MSQAMLASQVQDNFLKTCLSDYVAFSSYTQISQRIQYQSKSSSRTHNQVLQGQSSRLYNLSVSHAEATRIWRVHMCADTFKQICKNKTGLMRRTQRTLLVLHIYEAYLKAAQAVGCLENFLGS